MGFEILRLAHGEVSAEVVPERGALVSALRVGGTEILYLDRATLEDPAKNVRGGIPVLFPYAGKLVNETFVAAGTKMKQHGFGRNKPWAVREQRPDFLRLALVQDADTRAQYPYEYEAEYSVSLLPHGLHVELMVQNKDSRPLPVSPGWHPYFRCPAARKGAVKGDVIGFTADRLGDETEFDFGLVPPANGRTRFQVPDLGDLHISFPPDMRHMQFWSQPGRDFICLEPFFGPNNTVNTEQRLDVAPGGARDFWMRIELGE